MKRRRAENGSVEVADMVRSIVLGSVLGVMALACAKTPARDTSANGTVTLASFASPPSAVVATTGSGKEIRATLGANGAFSIVLPKGERYALTLETSAGRVPIVMPRKS